LLAKILTLYFVHFFQLENVTNSADVCKVSCRSETFDTYFCQSDTTISAKHIQLEDTNLNYLNTTFYNVLDKISINGVDEETLRLKVINIGNTNITGGNR